jgi:hypothetical protein
MKKKLFFSIDFFETCGVPQDKSKNKIFLILMKLPSLDAEFNAESEYLIRFASKSVLTHENSKLRGRFFYNSLIF